MRPYTRSAPVSLHIGDKAVVVRRDAAYSRAIIVDIDDENGANAGQVWFQNEAAMHLFAEALKGKVEA